MSVRWICHIRQAADMTRNGPTSWNSRANTMEEAREEAAEILGVPPNQIEVTSWDNLDWSHTDGRLIDPLK